MMRSGNPKWKILNPMKFLEVGKVQVKNQKKVNKQKKN